MLSSIPMCAIDCRSRNISSMPRFTGACPMSGMPMRRAVSTMLRYAGRDKPLVVRKKLVKFNEVVAGLCLCNDVALNSFRRVDPRFVDEGTGRVNCRSGQRAGLNPLAPFQYRWAAAHIHQQSSRRRLDSFCRETLGKAVFHAVRMRTAA